MRIDETIFRPVLITKGRNTGKEHSVMLRAVKYDGKIYFSRHRPDSDWFKNAATNSKVRIRYKDEIFTGNAKVVTDSKLDEKISELKYPGEKRAKEKRVTIEVILD